MPGYPSAVTWPGDEVKLSEYWAGCIRIGQASALKIQNGSQADGQMVAELESWIDSSVDNDTAVIVVLVATSLWKWIHSLGGLGLILLGLADNTPFLSAPPGSEDVFVILLSARHPAWWLYYGFMATLGEVAGGYLTYRLAQKSGKETLEKKAGKERAAMVYRSFERGGFFSVMLGAVAPPPFPFTSVLMAAGIMQCPRAKFFPALACGRGARFLAVAFFGSIYGQPIISCFSRYYRPLLYALIALAVFAGIGALVYFEVQRARKD